MGIDPGINLFSTNMVDSGDARSKPKEDEGPEVDLIDLGESAANTSSAPISKL